jgi:protein TonB
VSSAINTTTPETEKVNQAPDAATRSTPVALEADVSVTGARADRGAARELFTEETKTVLVFRDGAVIRLSALVAAGQLLFLTDKKTNSEVVCQVLHTRPCNDTSAYVNLQFTESRPNFWDVAFPDTKSSQEFTVKAHLAVEALTSGTPAAPVQPHTAADVDQLRKEVEALRKQLAELQQNNIVATPPANAEALSPVTRETPAASPSITETSSSSFQEPPAAPPVATGSTESSTESSYASNAHSTELADPNAPAPTTAEAPSSSPAETPAIPSLAEAARLAEPPDAPWLKQTQAVPFTFTSEAPLMPAAGETEKQQPARAVIGMSLPTRAPSDAPPKRESTPDPSEALLPTPSLDFSQMPSSPYVPSGYGLLRRPSTWTPQRLMALGVFLVVTLGVSLWLGKPWLYFGSHKTTTVAAASAPTPNSTATPSQPTSVVVTPAKSENAAPKPTNTTSSTATPTDNSSASSPRPTNDAGAQPVAETATISHAPAAKKSSTVAKPRGKTPASESSDVHSDTSAELPVSNAPVVAPKLLKAATPVYPPDAMLNYITGDVRAEALVEPDGHVSEVEILSGPKPLREAAIEAVKRYQYAPATQAGKSVPAMVTVTVKFWFDP